MTRDVIINVVDDSSAIAGVTMQSRALPVLGRWTITDGLFEHYNTVDEFKNEEGNFREESSMRVMYKDPGQKDEKK